ncbi:MAG: type II/IV secretion system protein [Armatimonadota bacterium]|nr:MAG: type II/IV secretion system protein [Armatimonadota bacterium]
MEEVEEIYSEHELYGDGEALGLLPRQFCERLGVFPVREEQGHLVVAMPDTENLWVIDEVTRVTGLKVKPAKAAADVIKRGILRYYSDEMEEMEAVLPTAPEAAEVPDGFADLVEQAPAVSAVNRLLEAATAERASDIHVEPHPRKLMVRFRVDSVMYDNMTLPIDYHASIVSRLKILARLNIAEKRLPQDGRFEGRFNGQAYDVRVSTVPSVFGETVVLRLLPKYSGMRRLKDLGLGPDHLETMEDILRRPYGMVLATGPTGSGKTTTLYAGLMKMDRISKNVITIEEPVEYQLPRVTQIQVHPKIGLTFAAGLRHILRQDPDVIMVGEIRDLETVQMAIQSALTGHLLFSTLHANDAAGAPIRLIDMGAEPFLVASSLCAIIAQRLVRRVCKACKQEHRPSPAILGRLGITDPNPVFYRGRGCNECRGTGYHGMVAVFEIVVVEDSVRSAVVRKASATEIRHLARELGCRSLRDDGIQKAREGITTVEEILRAVYVEA